MSRFREVFRFELDQRLRQPSTWLYLAVLLALALLRADSTDTDFVRFHAPINAAYSTLMVGVLATLITAGLFVEAAQRDLQARMEPLFYTTPLRRWSYLGGRFSGAMLLNALLLLVVPAGLLLGPHLLAMSPETHGTLRLAAYVLPFLVFLLPNLLVNAAMLFGVTLLSRRALPGYLGSLALTFAYMLALVGGRANTAPVWALLDPTGAVALSRLTGGWTRIEQNTLMVGLEGVLLWNRLLWTALGAGMLAFTIRRFRLAHPDADSRRAEVVPDARAHAVAIPEVHRAFGLRMRVRQLFAFAAIGARQIIRSRDFSLISIVLFGYALIAVAEAWLFGGTLFWPLTRNVAAGLAGQGIPTLIALLTVFYAGELVWRERDAGIEKLVDAAPVPDWVPLAGKFLALGAMLVTLHALLMAAGIFAQAIQGYYAFEPLLYVKILFGMQFPEALLFAVLALLVHVVVNQKYVGHAVAVLLYIGMQQAQKLGIEHHLLIYGSDPGWTYSDFNGFGPFLAPFVWFKAYWLAWALLLGVAALLFHARGAEGGLRARLRLARQRCTPRVAALAVAAMLLALGTGAFIFYNTNVLNEYGPADARHAEYERRYKRFEHLPQPSLRNVTLHVELYPERHAATMRATYRLVNDGSAPIDSVHLSSVPHPEVTLRGIRFDRPARPVVQDARHGYRIYALSLQPGQAVQMHFDLDVAPRGFRNRERVSANTTIVGDYTNLGSWLLPAIGYQREAELSNPAERREHGLPPSDVRPSIDDLRARRIPRIGRIRLEAIVGTTREQTAVVPGALQKSWTNGDRRYFHYRTEAPILNFFSVVSAGFAVREARWNDVTIRVFHHPRHPLNVDRIVRDAQRSLDAFTRDFGPYPHRQLWLVEFPRYASGARANGGTIVYSEASPMALGRSEVEPLALAAHEISHQWWGQQVMGADVEGSQMLSETLAQYSAILMLEREHGAAAARRILRRMHQTYLDGRARHETPEVPLLRTSDHDYMHYGKGAVVLSTLRDSLGEERVNTALRRFLEKHRMQGPPYPTTHDLYRELQAVTPAPQHALLHDLLGTITLWDLRATSATADASGRVTLEIEAAKLRADSVGNDTEVPMNDLVDIAVFDAGGKELYLARHRIRSGRQTVTVTVRGTPASAGIDPYHKLIVRHWDALHDEDVKVAKIRNGAG